MGFFANIVMKPLISIYSRWKVSRQQRHIKMLQANGLLIGKYVQIEPGAYIDEGYPYLISIGNNCGISRGAWLLAHDDTLRFVGGYRRLGKVEIRDNCIIGTNAIILPGTTIGPNALVAAGSLVNKDVPPNSCVAGVPARFYSKFDQMIERHKEQIEKRRMFNHEDLEGNPSNEIKEQVLESVKDGPAFSRGFPKNYPFTYNT